MCEITPKKPFLWLMAVGLTVALCGPVAPAEPAEPSMPVEFVQKLIEQRELQDDMATLRDTLRQILARRPKYATTTRLFDVAMREPTQFTMPLAAFNARLAQPWPDYPLGLLAEGRRQYRVENSCELPALVPPASLDEAVDQISRLAAHAVDWQRRALSDRSRRQLAHDYATFSRLRRDTIADALKRDERRLTRRFLKNLDSADMGAVLCAAHSWMRLMDRPWLEQLRTLMSAHPQSTAESILSQSTPHGNIVLGGSGDGRLRLNGLLFLADLGGDDFYGIEGNDFDAEPQFIVDFAGNDRYESSLPGGYAAGIGSVAVLIDQAGDDIYDAPMHSQGAAVLGVGLLLDLDGNDRYTADSHAQGAALYGIGLLLDRAGDDHYRVRALGQGIGMAHGLGVVEDLAGNDIYVAKGRTPTNYGTPGLTDAWAQGVARGVRRLAPGGIGRLADHDGNDRYDATSFAQGGGYYRGVGQLLDMGAGDDTLLGSRYNAGWGAHGGVGQFINAAGNDRYDTRHAVAGGLAWDYSLAVFFDGLGDDFYRLDDFSFGAAAHNAVGWFVDAGGNDVYADARTPAEVGPGKANFALFLDLGGNAASPDEECLYRIGHGFAFWTASCLELPEGLSIGHHKGRAFVSWTIDEMPPARTDPEDEP